MDITYYKKYEPIFGEWYIVREIGEGSFGKVFEIEREDFGYTYKSALKAITIPQNEQELDSILDTGMDMGSATQYCHSIVKELNEEFRLMSKLKGNSNVVSYEDHKVIEHTDGIGWDILIRMELLTPMLRFIRDNPMDRSRVIQLGIDICKALELCRKHGIVHRDIKPENIFVSNDGQFKLGDFGIARTMEQTTGSIGKKGTYNYMAPEVYKGEPYGPRVDIYSLGIVLYRYMNNGRFPFHPQPPAQLMAHDNEKALGRRASGEPIPAPVNADKDLAAVILKACAYRPDDRYANPTEMREDLEAVAVGAVPIHIGDVTVVDDRHVHKYTARVVPPTCTEEGYTVYTCKCGKSYESDAVAKLGHDFRDGICTRCGEEEGTTPFFPPRPPKPPIHVHSYTDKVVPPTCTQKGCTIHTCACGENHTDTYVKALGHEYRKGTCIRCGAKDPTAHVHSYTVKVVPPTCTEKGYTVHSCACGDSFTDMYTEAPGHDYKKGKCTRCGETDPGYIPAKPRMWKYIAAIGGLAAAIALFFIVSGGISKQNKPPAQPDWTEWQTELSQEVTEEDYLIEEKTQYRSRDKETKTSSKSTMDGWELLEVTESGKYGAWSDWSTKKVTKSDTRKVETEKRYRSRTLETTTSSSSSLSGWELVDSSTSRGDYGSWSSWSTTKPKSASYREIDSKTQYSYRTKSTSQQYTGWSGWSSWQDSSVSSNDLRKVETRTVYMYCYFVCPNCGAHMHGWGFTCPTWGGGCGKATIPESSYHEVWGTTPQNQMGFKDWHGTSHTYAYYNGELVFRNKYSPNASKTQYRYATRSINTSTNYSDWSSYSDTYQSSSSTKEVRTRTVYRYRDKAKNTTYYYQRWGDWSKWTTTALSETSSRQVETKTFYRYKDKTNKKTYTFYRWTDWSDWSETPVDKTDTNEVETKLLYRYKSK